MPHLTENSTPTTPPQAPRARLTASEKQRFNEVLDQTQRVKDAAQAMGIALPTAEQLAKVYGWKSPRKGPTAACGKPKAKYTQEQKNAFFTAFAKHQSVSKAAQEVNIPAPTCYQWAVKAGLETSKPRMGRREEFLRLRAQGMSRKEAAKQVGIHEETSRE
ncbi:helix-turn-helix domain-containing protein [Glutamicibacter sp. JC586]|uniref:helix-turn-helix domain-containing protein n=1 Tax=Glutamicibacter sp. JC586 TaxID=2590552 RepID=UPI00135B85F2|nr:helix-turn-helix domain-containing protein [Glutamicibacter sp. JC586]